MAGLRFTLVADGRSDQVLVHLLRWVLAATGVQGPLEGVWADLTTQANPPRDLAEGIRGAVEAYPCDILFIHRDAERDDRKTRLAEIRQAIRGSFVSGAEESLPHVCVVPVRMTEAWFLFDEAAIRRGARNPAGKRPLGLPTLSRVESIPNPKDALHHALRIASELGGRRLKGFEVGQAYYRVAEQIADYRPLRCLPAFQALEEELRHVVESNGWV